MHFLKDDGTVAVGLLLFALIGLCGMILLSYVGIEPPGELIATVSAAVGALSQRLNRSKPE